MNIDDDFGFAQLFGEALVFAAQLFEFRRKGVVLGFGAALLWGEGLEVGGVAFAAPVGQERGVETFAAEESADSAGTFGLIGLGEDAEFVFGGEASALGLGDDFGIGVGEGGAAILPSARLRSPSLRSGSLRPADGKIAGIESRAFFLFMGKILPALLSN